MLSIEIRVGKIHNELIAACKQVCVKQKNKQKSKTWWITSWRKKVLDKKISENLICCSISRKRNC